MTRTIRLCRPFDRSDFPVVAIGALAALLSSSLAGGCLVQEKCYDDADCPNPNVCNDKGRCEFQCRENTDCDLSFGTEFACQDNHCRYPESCIDCSFANAEIICVHGKCSMGACIDGYIDLDSDTVDGCEYHCTITNQGKENCDYLDNNCDGTTDEGFEFNTDERNCGTCNTICATPPHASPVCASAQCTFSCDSGWFDNNKQVKDGCEATECVPSEEICDGADNDCNCPGDTNGDSIVCGPGDENVDEGFDKTSPETCGPYCIECSYVHARAECIDQVCVMGACENNWYDANAKSSDGCECMKTNGGVEICDSIDNNCNGAIDEGEVCGVSCPAGMVLIDDEFCIDIYEASRSDATEIFAGSDNSIALSKSNVLPWTVNPLTYDHFLAFVAACQAAEKHLCSKDEWFLTCSGPQGDAAYVFGDVFDPTACNCVDTFCSQHCSEEGIPSDECNTSPNCGYSYYCFKQMPTGKFTECTNEYHTYDMNGNAWEVVPSTTDPRGYEVRGGAFNCASAAARLRCDYNAGWDSLYAGFRCCSSPQ